MGWAEQTEDHERYFRKTAAAEKEMDLLLS